MGHIRERRENMRKSRFEGPTFPEPKLSVDKGEIKRAERKLTGEEKEQSKQRVREILQTKSEIISRLKELQLPLEDMYQFIDSEDMAPFAQKLDEAIDNLERVLAEFDGERALKAIDSGREKIDIPLNN